MRVGIIAAMRHPLTDPYAGGMEAHTAELAIQLRAQGHDVSVFGPVGSPRSLVAEHDELPVLELSEAALRDVSAAPDWFMAQHHAYLGLMLRLQREASLRFDVIHDNALHYLTLSLASVVRVPVVATLHTPPTPWLESSLVAGPVLPTTFCAVSRHNAASWRHALGEVAVIPNGVDTDVFVAGPGGGTPVWSGRMVPEKGPDHAIRAARLAGTGLVLAGPIGDAGWFATHIEPLLGDGVVYAGHLGRSDLARLIGNAPVALVTPRWDEPYGLVVAEALACGTPVAAYDRGAVGEIVDPGTGCLAPPDDIPALAAALVLASSFDRRLARSRAVERWSSIRMARSYAALYAGLVPVLPPRQVRHTTIHRATHDPDPVG